MDEQLKSNLTSSKHWIRLLYMVFFALVIQVVSVVMTALVVVQFLFALITGNDNEQLRKFGDSLSIFIFETLQFLIYKREDKPFPFSDWPESDVGSSDLEESAQPKTKAKSKAKASASKTTTAKKAAAKPKAAAKKKVTPEPEPEIEDSEGAGLAPAESSSEIEGKPSDENSGEPKTD